MPGIAHEVLVVALRDDPSLLGALVERLTGHAFPDELSPIDASIRFVKTAEVRPDLLFRRPEKSWAIVELQNARDDAKRRRWLLAASVLHDQTGVLGDVFVVTSRRFVARWALEVAHVESKLGTKLGLTPVVLYVGPKEVAKLLDGGRPELALFAAWAVAHRRGREAMEVVDRAIGLADRLPVPLRRAQQRAIVSVLSDRMLAVLREASMDISKIPMSAKAREVAELLEARLDEAEARGLASGTAKGMAKGMARGVAKGVAKGKQQALFALLGARALSLTAKQRAAIEACTDSATLDAWIVKAASAGAVDEVLASAKVPAAPRRAAGKPAARKGIARR